MTLINAALGPPFKLSTTGVWAMRAMNRSNGTDELPFPDRQEAGERLARHLLAPQDRQPVVLALPRGGVPVGFEIARAFVAGART